MILTPDQKREICLSCRLYNPANISIIEQGRIPCMLCACNEGVDLTHGKCFAHKWEQLERTNDMKLPKGARVIQNMVVIPRRSPELEKILDANDNLERCSPKRWEIKDTKQKIEHQQVAEAKKEMVEKTKAEVKPKGKVTEEKVTEEVKTDDKSE